MKLQRCGQEMMDQWMDVPNVQNTVISLYITVTNLYTLAMNILCDLSDCINGNYTLYCNESLNRRNEAS